jgi:NitT/TauT family transport system substrate-binding protein
MKTESQGQVTRRAIARTALATMAAIGLMAAGGDALAQAKPLQKLRMTIPVPALVFYPIYVAQDKGFFADEGIEMEVVSTQGDGPDVDALIAGSVQFTASTPNRLLTTYEQGKPLKAVMSMSNKIGIHCFMNKESAEKAGITEGMSFNEKIKRLKGMTLGGTRPGAMSYTMGIDYAKRAGLVPQKDLKLVGIGGGPQMLAAIENRQVDVACFASPVVELAVSRGKAVWFINNALDEDKAYTEFLFELVYVRPDYAKENPETVRKVLRALVRGNEWILQATPQQHLEVLKKRFETVDTKVLLDSMANVRAAIIPSGCITPRALEAAVVFMKRVDQLKKDVPFNAVVDNSFLPKPCK